MRAARASLLSAALFLLGISYAHAMMPPWVYEKARAEAPYHIQVAIDDVTVPWRTPEDCQVSGSIVRIFRDTSGKLTNDETIAFPIACIRNSDEPLVGGTIWTDVDELKRARFIEVYLVDGENGLDTAKWQSLIIGAPSSTPQLPVK